MQKRGLFLYSFLPGILLALGLGVGGLKISTVASGDLIKGSLPAVYYYGSDNKRYVFPNDKVYFSWYADFSGVKTVSDSELASYPLGGNATYRPGTRLVKIQSDPRVYAVGKGGVLRWIGSETAAAAIFGADWNKRVDDIADAFFVNYSVGSPVNYAYDYDPSAEASADASINIDKNLSAAPPINVNSNTNTNTNTNANVNTNQPLSCPATCGIGSVCGTGECQAVPGPSDLSVKLFIVDSADLCFVGDACSGGNCCSVGGLAFADNDNLKTVKKDQAYLYADKQQLCGNSSVGTFAKHDINDALVSYSEDVGTKTATRVNAGNSQANVNGQLTMSRIPGSCDWWYAPSDLAPFTSQNLDPSVDAVFVVASRYFNSGLIPGPDVKNSPPGSGLRGAGYYYMTTQAVDAGNTYMSLFENALTSAQDMSFAVGLFDASKAIIGNHCRDNKKDFDETGVDCGGAECNVCY
jgi:hypothetical protein